MRSEQGILCLIVATAATVRRKLLDFIFFIRHEKIPSKYCRGIRHIGIIYDALHTGVTIDVIIAMTIGAVAVATATVS